MPNSIFVLTPIGSEGSDERKRADEVLDIISPIAVDLDMKVVRADLLDKPGRITTQIVQAINEASVVIADLTGHNPNVMYELGVADTLGKPAIIITDDPSGLPFDRAHERAFRLDSMHFKEVRDFTKKLRNALHAAMGDDEVDNPVTAAAGVAALSERAPTDPVAEELVALSGQIEGLNVSILQLLHPSTGIIAGAVERNRRVAAEERRLRAESDYVQDRLAEEFAASDQQDLDFDFPRD